MNDLVNDKLNEIINIFDNSIEIKKLTNLKGEIYSDEKLKVLLSKLRDNESNKYSNEYIALKREIIDYPIIKQYKELETHLYFLVLEINKRLNSILQEKRCRL